MPSKPNLADSLGDIIENAERIKRELMGTYRDAFTLISVV